jgi:glycosyltransferase involved in cell wall biosynthesis
MDLISIIIPYYKKKKFIKETINSVLKQTYKNIEIILIYDDEDQKDLDYIKSIKKFR